MNQIDLTPIGYIESPYKEKFAIPRQPGLVPAAKGKIKLTHDSNSAELVKGLEQFSHLWVIFYFHATQAQGWKPQVRPPRLGGNEKIGVLATRSTFRPNPIGLSVVKLDDVNLDNNQVTLEISALDLLDGTPVLDIKPYIPYADAIPNAEAGYAQQEPEPVCEVSISPSVGDKLTLDQNIGISELIKQVLQQDPRPAYKRGKPDDKQYGIKLGQYNILWRMANLTSIEVYDIETVK